MLSLDNRGSSTIEAAVIIPFTLFVIASLITLSFALFNRCSLERCVISSSLRASEAVFESNSERYNAASQTVKEVLVNNLLYRNNVESNIEVKGEKIKVVMCADEDEQNFYTSAEKTAINPVFFVRNCRKIKNLIGKTE